MPHGIDDAAWDQAKAQAKELLAERARCRGFMAYGDLAQRLEAIHLEPHDPRFFWLLGEISTEEAKAGRGMMTALVVHKDGDMQPGPGFFELARDLGFNTSDILACWVEQFKKVHAAWARI